jgi:hypothetical protein
MRPGTGCIALDGRSGNREMVVMNNVAKTIE